MTTTNTFTNHFLIAMPALADPNFFHSVTYVCEHSADGALGIVINRPMDITLTDVLAHMSITLRELEAGESIVYVGGPVQPERGFVLHRPPKHWESTLQITPSLAVTTSKDILTAIAKGKGPERALVALGYAGWGPGQLERELADNAWLSGPADESIIFDVEPDKRWQAAAAAMGVDLSRLSSDVGHA